MLLHVFLADDQCIVAFAQREIALLVAKPIGLSGLGLVNIGKVVEVEARFQQLVFVDFAFARRIELGQDAAIFAQDVVDIAHEVVGIAVQAVVVG